ncbi:MAG: hypothetical protein ACYCOR_02540 [Acidobacteriaceae bacterium]
MEAAKTEFLAADLECMDMEAVLDFAEELMERPKQLWLESSLNVEAQEVVPIQTGATEQGSCLPERRSVA